MSRTKYLYVKHPISLLYILDGDEYLFLMCLLEREGYINRNVKGEGFSVTNDAIKAALNWRMNKPISGSNTKKLNSLRQSLAEKGLIDYKFDEDTNKYYYFIQWQAIEEIGKYNSDYYINLAKENAESNKKEQKKNKNLNEIEQKKSKIERKKIKIDDEIEQKNIENEFNFNKILTNSYWKK